MGLGGSSQVFKLNETEALRRHFLFYLVDATDGKTPETGEAGGQPQVSKNGGAWNNTSATLVAIGNGAYYVVLVQAEIDTLAEIMLRYKSANTEEFNAIGQVVAYDPYDSVQLGLSALGNLSSGSSAVNTFATGFVLTDGNEVANTFAVTKELDGVYHQIDDADGTPGDIDGYYKFLVGGDGSPVRVTFTGRINSINDSHSVFAYNWGTTTFEQVGTWEGQATPTDVVNAFNLYTTHVGTVSPNIGEVRIQLLGTSLTSPDIFVDQVFVSYSVVRRTVGYSLGAIWVDTNGSNTNTEPFVDGTADNPVSTWAAALTLSSSLNLIKFQIVNGSTITLTGNSDKYTMDGENWTLVLDGQSIAGIAVRNADASGTSTGASPDFSHCHLNNVTAAPGHYTNCGLSGTFTALSAGDYYFDNCHSMVAGTSTPIFDYVEVVGAVNVNFRDYSGGIEVRNMSGSDPDTMSLEGNGQLIIHASCVGGLIAVRGNFEKTDNSGGGVTLSEEARYDGGFLVSKVWDKDLSGHDILRTAADYIKRIFKSRRRL